MALYHDQNLDPPQMVIILRTQAKPYYGTRTTQPSAPPPIAHVQVDLKERAHDRQPS